MKNKLLIIIPIAIILILLGLLAMQIVHNTTGTSSTALQPITSNGDVKQLKGVPPAGARSQESHGQPMQNIQGGN